jgi:hypothetical protein
MPAACSPCHARWSFLNINRNFFYQAHFADDVLTPQQKLTLALISSLNDIIDNDAGLA